MRWKPRCGSVRPRLTRVAAQRQFRPSEGRYMQETATARVAGFQRTKLYDLLAALPLVAWYLFGLGRQMPLTLIRVQELTTGTITTLAFLQLIALAGSMFLIFVLILLLITRKTPELKTCGLLPRAVALGGAFLGNGFLYLKAVPLSLPAQAIADILIIGGAAGSL